MKRIHIFLISLFFMLTQTVLAQNAPHTTAGSLLDVSGGTITIPVTVSDFENIGSIALTLDYDPATMTYVGSTANSAFSGMSIAGSTPGQVVIGWFASSGAITLPDGCQLLEIEFNYISGSTSLSWDNTSNNGAKCEYTDEFYQVLNDSPTADFYTDGFVTSHAAPITYAPNITDASTGAIDVPITIENFSDIGGIALTLEYNPNILNFTGSTANSSFGGTMVVASSPAAGGKYKVVISWMSAMPDLTPVTLPDGSTLVNLHFDYAPALFGGNYSELTWTTDGTACEYGDEVYNPLYDQPYEDFYIDGLVTAQLAPATYLSEITNAVPALLNVAVTVTGFQDIGSVALTFEYDASVINYESSTPNSAFNGSLNLNNVVSGNDGKIIISYYGATVTIADLDYIADIAFTYISGTTTLAWKTDGTSCDYGDVSYNHLWDSPYEDYYFNGLVAGQVAPRIKADSMSAAAGTQISIPLKVWDFTDISSFSLSIDYDPGVLTYLGASPHPGIASSFTEGVSNPGRIALGWFNATNPKSLPDETALIYLNFTYNGGTSPIIWYDNGSSCEFTTGTAIEVLYDQPTEDYYFNGLAEAAGFIWTGITSTEWLTASNWSDNIVPNALSAVSIPSTPPSFWPVYTGNFTLGNQCNHIDLGDGSEMTVTGDMIIEPGHTFMNAGAGILRVGGNWSNTGVFDPRTGTVVFTSPLGNIPSGILPANEVQNYLLTTSPALLTPISGGVAGPTGSNASVDVGLGFTFAYAGTNYTGAKINTNGWLSLNLSGLDAGSNDNSKLFFSDNPTDALAPWWDDLMADGSSNISYLTSGTTPNRVFTVEWKDVLAHSSGATARLNFQLNLYETTNVVEFCYGTVTAGVHAVAEGASIGIKGPVGGTGDFIEATTGTTNTLITDLKSDQVWPMVNYIFTPPTDTVTFNKLRLSSGASLNIQTDVNVAATSP